ncbi:MAG TPA: FAD-dependent oxidoreductase [Acidimicrobiia bacterium]|jgi:NADH dehydrogenase|nr:FAD-dependent oxidoreductase [Acidimicrobiia bacterium]
MAWYDVLVVGGGFGGAFGARRLEQLLADRAERILLVAPTNFMLFSPLLPEAASGTLEPRHAVIPLRELLSRTEVLVGEVAGLDAGAKTAEVRTAGGEVRHIEFGRALLAPGSVPSVFPIPGLTEHAVGFKTLADAIWLRNRVLHQLDVAEGATDRDTRRRQLTFTFIGGGYAGVEALAELESMARDAVRRYPSIVIEDFRWVLVEAQDSLLPGLHPKLASFTEKVLRKRGIEIHLQTRLESCEDRIVTLSGAQVAPYRSETIVWTAGQRPSPTVAGWGLPVDDRGFVPVDRGMRVRGLDGFFAVGDAAAVPDPGGGTSPNTAQHALRQAWVAAANVAASLGAGAEQTFDYRTRGLAVTLGKWQGTAQVKRFTFTGPLAWWMGRSYHLLMMPGLARKSRVVSDWTMGLLFPRDVSQLGSLGSPSPLG